MKDIIRAISCGNAIPDLVASHLSPNVKELERCWRGHGVLWSTTVSRPPLGILLQLLGSKTKPNVVFAIPAKISDQEALILT